MLFREVQMVQEDFSALQFSRLKVLHQTRKVKKKVDIDKIQKHRLSGQSGPGSLLQNPQPEFSELSRIHYRGGTIHQ